MFSEWSRPYAHLDPGSPEGHKLILTFREGTVRNERLSAAGLAVYDRVFQVQVGAIGQKQSRPIYEIMRVSEGKDIPNGELMNLSGSEGRMASVTVYDRFKRAFEDYRQNIAPSTNGIPLEHWPLMTSEIVRAFRDANVHSVEDLANASDSVAQHVRAEFYKWRTKAQAWLETARKEGGDVQARAELSEVREQLAEAQRQIAQLLSAQNAAPRPEPKRRGRPPKEAPLEVVFVEPEESRL